MLRTVCSLALIVAGVSALSHQGKLVSSVGNELVFGDPTIALVRLTYDFEFAYSLILAYDNIYEDENGVPSLIDNYLQVELWQEANVGFNVNLFGFYHFAFSLNIKPFHLVPLWISLYQTHAGRWAQTMDLNIFMETGYEVSLL